MKKTLVLILTLVMMLSLAACGGEERAEQAGDTEAKFVSKTFGYISMSVPDVFKAVEEKDGMYVSSGPDASIVVLPNMEVELLPSEWDESLAEEALELYYGTTYTDLALAAYEGDVNMNGNTAVYYAFNGVNAEGKERLVQVVRLYNADLTAQYAVTFIQNADDDFFTEEVGSKIINSITLSPDAQHLATEFEG